MITTARKLANASPRRPRQADLKRAVSTAYYALFQAIAKDAADMIAGVGQNRPEKAWVQTYRSLQHSAARLACGSVRDRGFPQPLITTADTFVKLQVLRHSSDYDPEYRVTRLEVLQVIDLAENAIRFIKSCPRRDRLAFAVLLLFPKPRT